MPREPRRAGGVCLGALTASAHAMLDEARALFPGARVELVSLEGEELQARLEQAAYLVLAELGDEPLPRELIDGFANGLAVIAPDEGAAADLIEPGRNGLIYEAGSARELARRLAWAEAFPEKMRQMGECARADYLARFIGDWSYRKLYGERRRTARL
jgi:glycosyltransferase involved in cell wall biosynthesis